MLKHDTQLNKLIFDTIKWNKVYLQRQFNIMAMQNNKIFLNHNWIPMYPISLKSIENSLIFWS